MSSVVGTGTVVVAALAAPLPPTMRWCVGALASLAVAGAARVVPASAHERDPLLVPSRRRLYSVGFTGGAVAFTALASAATAELIAARATAVPVGLLSSCGTALVLAGSVLMPARVRRAMRVALVASAVAVVPGLSAPTRWAAIGAVPVCAVGWEGATWMRDGARARRARLLTVTAAAALTAVIVARPWGAPPRAWEPIGLLTGAALLLVSAAGNVSAVASWTGVGPVKVAAVVAVVASVSRRAGVHPVRWLAVPACATAVLYSARGMEHLRGRQAVDMRQGA